MNICIHCRGRDGKPKELYDSKRHAEKVLKTLPQRDQAKIKIYPCPYSLGWHFSRK